MENSTVSGLRSRSRSKTPFLRSSCDRENCQEGGDHTHHKSGRRTPSKRSTPVKQLMQASSSGKRTSEPIIELDEDVLSPPVHRTRASIRTAAEKLIKTSDYSSEESLDRLKGNRREMAQNQQNYRYEYERVTTSTRSGLGDVTLSPIHASYNASNDRSTRFGSPAYSACSTDSSFAEQALADASTIIERDPQHNTEHLPYRLYRMAGEYWNKYPKTDYTYSPLSRDRVELAPGQIAVPNMSRRSLSQFRVQGPNTSQDEIDHLATQAWASDKLRKRYTSIESSDDESAYTRGNGGVYPSTEQRWWITRLLVTIVTTITSATSATYRKVFGPSHRYPYTPRQAEAGLVSRASSAAAAPFYWIYTIITKVVTTTVTTITETISPSAKDVSSKSSSLRTRTRPAQRRWWPWLLLLLLPLAGYGCYNHYEEIKEMLPQYPTESLPIVIDTYKPPSIIQDPDLNRRLAALEEWALSVDTKLKSFDQKQTKIDSIEAQIESYSIKHLQKNLIQILNVNTEGGQAIALNMKKYLDKEYATKEDMERMSQEMYARLKDSQKPEMDEESIREIIREYLAVFERKQLEVIVHKIKEYVSEVRVERVETGFDVEYVKKIVAGMLEVYDADKTGIVDYILESAGGQVISTKCTEPYQIKTKQYSVLGIPWWVFTSPRAALRPGAVPGDCWAFQGFPGYLVVRTYAIIEVTGFSMEHMSKLLAIDGKIESAPKNFSVYGLRDEMDSDPHLFGDYMYDDNGTSVQYFPVKHPKTENIAGVEYPLAYNIVELRIESNHGNPTYTCVYRFRVHGNPLSDIRTATDDTLRDSET